MKTIKQLEKEIEENALGCPYNKSKQDKDHRCLDCDVANDVLNTKIHTIKEVLKEIDKWWKEFCEKVLDDGQDEEIYFEKLKAKLVGK